jgi:ABC-2 type transport system ATP-binding protein
MKTEQNIIQTFGIGKRYKDNKVLHNLNLEVPRNSIFGFLGPNGAGKTTAMKILLGFIKATEGRASMFGKDIRTDGVEIRSKIGYLSQDPRFYDNLTTRENLRLTARFFFKNNKKAIEKRIDEVIELTGLSQAADRRVKGFSGGERQRLGIAQAQINFPELLILDEPTAALDPIGRKQVLDVMDNLRDRTTIFYSTHILSDVQRVSDMVAILDGGVCIAQGNIEELMTKNSGPVYTVKGRGNLEGSVEMLSALPWVSDVTCRHNQPEGYTGMNIEVADSQRAEESLLRLLMRDPSVTITQFGLKPNELEDTFLNIITEGVK